tara:strand:- start:1753 stop:2058 length:306 start_codon:yes stop_codon:yes gene_type:complete
VKLSLPNESAGVTEWVLLAVTGLIFVVSAIGVVWSVHQTRLGYAELQTLEADRDALESEYERLLLEQGAFADYARVDQVAREELGMYTPPAGEVVIVKRAQ